MREGRHGKVIVMISSLHCTGTLHPGQIIDVSMKYLLGRSKER